MPNFKNHHLKKYYQFSRQCKFRTHRQTVRMIGRYIAITRKTEKGYPPENIQFLKVEIIGIIRRDVIFIAAFAAFAAWYWWIVVSGFDLHMETHWQKSLFWTTLVPFFISICIDFVLRIKSMQTLIVESNSDEFRKYNLEFDN